MYPIKMYTRCFMMLLLMLFSLSVYAEEAPFRVDETDSLRIKLSDDGTGIIKDIHCSDCDFSRVKITANSRATANGVEVSILEAKKRAGKFAMVSFDPETREVQYIRWTTE